MNTWLSWRPDERLAQAVRAMLRRGTRVSHHLFSIVGGFAVLTALALWLLPNVRTPLAAKLMPVISAAVQAGPARLLSGHPLPAFGPANGTDETLSSNGPAADNTRYDGAFDGTGQSGLNYQAPNSFDMHTQPPTVGMLANLIPSQRVAPDARNNHAFASTAEQNLVTNYLARRYRVAQEPIGDLVKAAFETGRDVGLDPLLLLAVMAIESGFNPYAESGVGAQGLMQVMAKVHSDKFQYFGGTSAALEPMTNIKVGALVLKDCIARGGSLLGGLRLYVGSTSQDDGGYGAKVMAERDRLRDVARGRKVPINAPQAPPQQQAAAATNKRVQVSLDNAHAIAAAKTAAASSPAADQDDASANASTPKHNSGPEFGA
ncbi:transglycosylase SLT domain-containing protein [Trinickia mobilis]|uniref:transglycosylase SLT domain-containing protein n=1 Tax=Trinickia mobilis TaxID=2816356 RepID=UPI001A8F7677|nr:transglycosylase SLT domain-containing protein [Trinickia mobilis]